MLILAEMYLNTDRHAFFKLPCKPSGSASRTRSHQCPAASEFKTCGNWHVVYSKMHDSPKGEARTIPTISLYWECLWSQVLRLFYTIPQQPTQYKCPKYHKHHRVKELSKRRVQMELLCACELGSVRLECFNLHNLTQKRAKLGIGLHRSKLWTFRSVASTNRSNWPCLYMGKPWSSRIGQYSAGKEVTFAAPLVTWGFP